jgi:hypothetical protein
VISSNSFEHEYLLQMRKDCRFSNLNILDGVSDTGDLEELITRAGSIRRAGGYEKLWCMINPTDIEVRADEEEKLLRLAKTKKVALVYNNPGLELWLLLHFQPLERTSLTGNKIKEKLSTYLPAFEASEQYLLSGEGRKLHVRLFPRKAQAMLHAQRLMQGIKGFGIGSDHSLIWVSMPSFLKDLSSSCGPCYMSQSQFA